MTMTLRFFFFFNDTATTEIYTLSLHDALPISFFSARRRDRYVGSSSSALTTQSARSPSSSSGAFPRLHQATRYPNAFAPATSHAFDDTKRRSPAGIPSRLGPSA